MDTSAAIADALREVGPRLRRARAQRGLTLTELAATTGISKSTLSRLESGERKPSLELLLPIAQAYRLPLDELVGAPEVGDPRIRFQPRRRNGRIVVPLTRQPGSIQAWKVIIPPSARPPEPRTHEGYEWLYVLSGRMRLILADHDITMGPGEVAEFDTRLPHWFGAASTEPVEILSLLGRQGERLHVRAAPAGERRRLDQGPLLAQRRCPCWRTIASSAAAAFAWSPRTASSSAACSRVTGVHAFRSRLPSTSESRYSTWPSARMIHSQDITPTSPVERALIWAITFGESNAMDKALSPGDP